MTTLCDDHPTALLSPSPSNSSIDTSVLSA
jgi:hypothetical protein